MTVFACITRDEQGPKIECSTDGLTVNQQPTNSSWLKEGDIIQIGYSAYRVVDAGISSYDSFEKQDTQPIDEDFSTGLSSALEQATPPRDFAEPKADASGQTTELSGEFESEAATDNAPIDLATTGLGSGSLLQKYMMENAPDGADAAGSADDPNQVLPGQNAGETVVAVENQQFESEPSAATDDAPAEAELADLESKLQDALNEVKGSIEATVEKTGEVEATPPAEIEQLDDEPAGIVTGETKADKLTELLDSESDESPEDSLEKLLAALKSVNEDEHVAESNVAESNVDDSQQLEPAIQPIEPSADPLFAQESEVEDANEAPAEPELASQSLPNNELLQPLEAASEEPVANQETVENFEAEANGLEPETAEEFGLEHNAAGDTMSSSNPLEFNPDSDNADALSQSQPLATQPEPGSFVDELRETLAAELASPDDETRSSATSEDLGLPINRLNPLLRLLRLLRLGPTCKPQVISIK